MYNGTELHHTIHKVRLGKGYSAAQGITCYEDVCVDWIMLCNDDFSSIKDCRFYYCFAEDERFVNENLQQIVFSIRKFLHTQRLDFLFKDH
jgi:hypothetical protein